MNQPRQKAAAWKVILGVVIGLVVALVLITAIQLAKLHFGNGAAPDFEAEPEAFAQYMRNLPATAFLLVLVSYVVGSFGGGYASAAIARTSQPAVIVGLLLTLGCLFNLTQYPHPLWFSVLAVFLILPCTWGGAQVVIKAHTETASEN